MKQCKIFDIENKKVHGGILLDDGSVICGCCGGLIEADEIGDNNDSTHRVLRVYENWIDLTFEICGDDLVDDG